MTCPKNLSKSEIFMEFGKDDMDSCNSCPNLSYKNGTLTCRELEKKDDDDEN